MALISQGLAYTRAFLMVLTSDHISGAGGRTVTGSVGKSAGPWASFSGAVTEAGGGWYIYTYSVAETNTLGDLRVAATASSCDPTDFADQVVGYNPQSNLVPWNPNWDAEVQSEVDDALVAQRLDELLNADSDIDGAAPPAVGSVFHELLTSSSVGFTFAQSTDSLEAIRDRGDLAWITATGFATPTNITAGTITSVSEGLTVVNLAANAIAPASAGVAFFNRIIDIAARRQYTNIRSSSDGETAVRWSLLGAIARLVNRTDFRTQPATIYHENGSTSFFTESMTTASTADAVTQLT